MKHEPDRPPLPAGVWVLGGVSLLMDVSSEMIHSLLPVFMVVQLGSSALLVGIVESLAEATAQIVKVFSGALSDFLGRRKALALAGYGLGALSKPLFALAASVELVLAARLIDRLGKGVRGAPRDALVADLTPPPLRGAAFGLRQSLDSVGAVLGPLLAVGLMALWQDDFRQVFWAAVVPGVLSVALLAIGLREPAHAIVPSRGNPIRRDNLARLGRAYWTVVLVGGVFTLARFSEAFLVLKAQAGGLPLAAVPLVLVVMNIVYAAAAYPFGRLSDSVDHRRLLAAGLAVLVAADLVLARAAGLPALMLGAGLWGAHMAMTQGLLLSMVAGTCPADLRATAFGVFNLVTGVVLLLGSAIAGWLWDLAGPSATFYTGAGFAGLALLGVLAVTPLQRR